MFVFRMKLHSECLCVFFKYYSNLCRQCTLHVSGCDYQFILRSTLSDITWFVKFHHHLRSKCHCHFHVNHYYVQLWCMMITANVKRAERARTSVSCSVLSATAFLSVWLFGWFAKRMLASTRCSMLYFHLTLARVFLCNLLPRKTLATVKWK